MNAVSFFALIGLILSSGYLVADAASKVGENKAYGDRDVGDIYFCNLQRPDLEKKWFVESASHLDNIYKNLGLTPEQASNRIIGDGSTKYKALDELGEMIGCLKQMGIDHESLYKFGPNLRDGLEYAAKNHPENLYERAPNFAKNVFEIVPEFGIKSVDGLIVSPPVTDNPAGTQGGGCLIATAAFGTELAPQVQLLREMRDNTLLKTASGSGFMAGFNSVYYSFSPAVADLERQNPMFKEAVKVAITPMLSTLSILNYVDIDSEQEMLGYGIGIILLNVGMYFIAPAFIIIKLTHRKI